jgi:hypothetical protein
MSWMNTINLIRVFPVKISEKKIWIPETVIRLPERSFVVGRFDRRNLLQRILQLWHVGKVGPVNVQNNGNCDQ